MKALTIQQPYAHLIVTPTAELPPGYEQKHVENRTWWKQRYLGNLLIHAGKGQDYLAINDRTLFPEMAFGAIVGVTKLIAVLTIDTIERGKVPPGLEWVKAHAYTEGPICLVLGATLRFAEPIPYRGQQGLFNIPDDILGGLDRL